MAVKAAYISKQGPDYLISPHFKLGEHRCPGVDKVLYSSELYAGLERLRAYGGFRITINSGYRSAAYNKKIHGATASKHIYGYAADIHVEKDGVNVSGKLVCCLAQALGFPGIGYMSETSTHLDMRPSGKYRGNEKTNYSNNVGGDFFKYFGISKAQITALKVESEGDDMTEQEVRDIIAKVEEENKGKSASGWSAEAREWAESNGIITGDENKNMMYKLTCTREMVVTFLYRFWKLIKG